MEEEKHANSLLPTQPQDGGIVAAAISGFVAGVACVIGLLKIFGKE